MSGSNKINQNEMGTPDESNAPSSRQNALGWTDISGNLWLFGGISGKTNKYSDVNIA
jgi:hypothetical protein